MLRLLQALTTGLAASAGPCHARGRGGKALISERGQPLSKKTGQAFQLHELLYHRLIVVVCSPLYGWLFCVCLLCCCLLLICLLALRTLLELIVNLLAGCGTNCACSTSLKSIERLGGRLWLGCHLL